MGIGISATTDPNPHCFRISDPPFSFYLDPDTEIGGPGCRKKYLFHLFLIIFENLDLSYIFLMVRIRNFYKSLEPELEFSKRLDPETIVVMRIRNTDHWQGCRSGRS